MEETERPRSNLIPAAAAIIVVALITAGVIFLAARAAPDECEKWNTDLRSAALNVGYARDALANLDAHQVVIRAEVQEAESEMRTLLAAKPDEDCEIDDEVEAEVRRVTDL